MYKFEVLPYLDLETNYTAFSHIVEKINNITLDVIYIASSIEIFTFNEIISYDFTDKLQNSVNIEFISNGCISFQASILEFICGKFSNAAVVFLEGDQNKLQHIMDCLGFDRNSKEWLSSQPGYGYCLLTKHVPPTNPLCWINNLDILSLPTKGDLIGISQKIINSLSSILSQKKFKIVSFHTNTKFSRILLGLIRSIINKNVKLEPLNISSWLPSYEHDVKHFHSLKPLLEINAYKDYL